MSNKICGKCHIFDDMHDYCIIAGDRYVNSPACDCFVDKCQKSTSPTVFDQITPSPEVLAEKSVYAHECCRIPDGATSPFIDEIFWFDDEKGDTWDERFDSAWEKAIAATVAKLKEVV